MSVVGKQKIVVYAFHLYESSGGFFWMPFSDANVKTLLEEMEKDRSQGGATSGAVAVLSVLACSPDEVTKLLEGELQDALEVGALGQIIKRYSDEPEVER